MLPTEPYLTQRQRWPERGRHILACFDEDSIVVYQAYRPAIGNHAVEHQRFGGEFSLSRMSWIKPNFLWMMYRSGWGTKEGQEVTLAVRLRRIFFDHILEQAVPSSHDPDRYSTRDAWQEAVKASDVRLQWDPDHAPGGAPEERRAIQLGLRGRTLERYAHEEVVEILDVSSFVAEQRAHRSYQECLLCPREAVYSPSSPEVRAQLRLDDPA